MAIAKKGKRKIVVNDRVYYWYVYEDVEFFPGGFTLNIASESKSFLVRYPLNQPKKQQNRIIVEGKEFGGNNASSIGWQQIICPKFDETETITPSIVRKIILWSLTEKENKFIDWSGNQIL